MLNAPVSRILLSDDGSRARGVVLNDGNTTFEADIVICNADLVYSYANLLPPTSYSRSLAERSASCSSISFYWALDKQFPELTAHNIFLAERYKESFDSIFKKHEIPEEPSFYVNVPSRLDSSAAPEGCDSVVVLVPVGHLLANTEAHKGTPSSEGGTQDWDAMVSIAREMILNTIESRLNISLAPHVVHEYINTPISWKSSFNLDRGAILGLSHSFFNVLSFRPKTKHPNIGSLYFVGASTHPGTGVPIVLAGATLVSEQILERWNRKAPWWARPVPWASENDEVVNLESSPLDRIVGPPLVGWSSWALIMLSAAVIAGWNFMFGRCDWNGTSFGGDW